MPEPVDHQDTVERRKQELVVLQTQREALELQASAISAELNAPGQSGEHPVGVKGSLVDSDGFPLAGFDLFNVREKRHRFNCIQTDHKAIMARIEQSLHALHEAQASRLSLPSTSPGESRGGADSTSASRISMDRQKDAGENAMSMIPIAKVNQVSEGSPAASAGLMVGDLVLRFGEVDISHPKGLSGVVDVVREKEGQEVPVMVLKHSKTGEESGIKELKLIPRIWAGRGLLGVHLLPP